jgi:ATP-dependent DNA helicase RecG
VSNNPLITPIEYLKGVGPAKADTLKKELQVFTFGDLLQLYPFRYVDRSRFYKIAELNSTATEIQLVGKITQVEELSGSGRNKRLKAHFEDGSGSVELIWFQAARYIKDALKLDVPYVLFGKPNYYNNRYSFPHPELELLTDFKASPLKGLQPIYSSTEKLSRQGLNTKGIAKLIRTLLPQLKNSLPEFYPAEIRQQFSLASREASYFEVHFPQSLERLEAARNRVKFDEFFLLQMEMVHQKQHHQQQFRGFAFAEVGAPFTRFFEEVLPFSLTDAQKRVLKEIRKDVMHGAHMNRLVQGDVGSGKTIVALMSMLLAIGNGFQACLMAPTEILATQHYHGIAELLEKMDLKVALLTGSVKAKERKEIHASLEDGSLHILIGTHALIEEKVRFKNLGLAVVDEQHRFGVAQRAKLWKKNTLPPHILIMTATPIPRTLAMAVYGDLDISVIDELPPGRKPIQTIHQYDSNRLKVFGFMKEEIAKGRQVYVVYPLIEESETMDYKDLHDGYDSITRAFPQPEYQVSIVHGKMSAQDKEFEMQRFVKGQTNIMVATTVIEVGVNVPNASVMVIESAERFGLSQLHQLRGRVGRGAEKSYCILMSAAKLSKEAKTRLATMVKTNDGFEIADTDMKLRGPGDLMGTRQSGVLNLKMADVGKDGPILAQARQAAQLILQEDPKLELEKHRSLRSYMQQRTKGIRGWGRIS